MRRLLIGVVAVVAVTLVVLAVFRRTETTTTVLTVPVAGVALSGDLGQVTVVGSGRPDVAVTVRQRYTPVRPTVELESSGAELRVRADCPWWVLQCAIDVVVDGPNGLTVQVETESGDVTVRGVDGAVDVVSGSADVALAEVGGAVSVRTGSGAVALTSVAGDTQVRTGSGDVAGTALRSTRLGVEVGAGEVTLDLADRPVDVGVRVGAGAVRITLPPGAYQVDARSDAGSVSVGVPQDPAADAVVAVATGAGDVEIVPAAAG